MHKRTIGERLKYIREKRGISGATLAVRAKVSRSLISQLETGKRNGELTAVWVMKNLARELGITTDYLLGAQEDDEDEAA